MLWGADGRRVCRAVRRTSRIPIVMLTAKSDTVVPVLLTLAFGVVAVGRVAQTRMAVGAVVREAARAGALADSGPAAVMRGEARGHQVASDHRLTNGTT